jgi:hypothetical protein
MRTVAEIREELGRVKARLDELYKELAQVTIVAWVGVIGDDSRHPEVVSVSSETWNDFGWDAERNHVCVVVCDHYDGGVRFLAEVVENTPSKLYHRGMEESIWCCRFNTREEAERWTQEFKPPEE